MPAGWLDAARWEASRLRVHPEEFPHLTREARLRLIDELEDSIARATRFEREPREGPPWFDFENEADE